jgi:hypothetical protein
VAGRGLVVADRERGARRAAGLLLWWLFSQRRHRLSQVLVDSEDGAAARLDGRTLEDVIEEEAQGVRGTGTADRPTYRSGRTCAAAAEASRGLGANPGATDPETLVHARDSAGLGRLPSKVRLREARHRADRVA